MSVSGGATRSAHALRRLAPLALLVVVGALAGYVGFGVLTALFSDAAAGVPHWLAHPQAYALALRALDYAALTLFWLAVFLLAIPPLRPSGAAGPPRRGRARVALAGSLPIVFAGALAQLWGFAALLCVVAGWAVALALRGRPRRFLCAALALAGCAALVSLYFGAEIAVREAWRTRNLALLADVTPYPGARLLGVHTGDGYSSAVGAWTNDEELRGLLLTRWHIPQAASSTRLRYQLPSAITRNALLTWYRRQLGPGWQWRRYAEAAGQARRDADLIWVYAPYPGGRDQTGPGEIAAPGYSVEAWRLVPGVTYGDQSPSHVKPIVSPSVPATPPLSPPAAPQQ